MHLFYSPSRRSAWEARVAHGSNELQEARPVEEEVG
jgi:hypothetical protein